MASAGLNRTAGNASNTAAEYRSAEGQPDRLAAAARELVAIPVDVIVVYGTVAAHAAQQATTTTPIVMIAIGDPIQPGWCPVSPDQAEILPAILFSAAK
jgi:putative tryptophan/tyrosine transport system substrate-binding protein